MKKYMVNFKFLTGGQGKRIEQMTKLAKQCPFIAFSVTAENKTSAEQLAYKRLLREVKRLHKKNRRPMPSKIVENYEFRGKGGQIVDVDLNGDIWFFVDKITAKTVRKE